MTTKQCFVIAPIGEPDSETRKRSDQVLKHVIRPAAKNTAMLLLALTRYQSPVLSPAK